LLKVDLESKMATWWGISDILLIACMNQMSDTDSLEPLVSLAHWYLYFLWRYFQLTMHKSGRGFSFYRSPHQCYLIKHFVSKQTLPFVHSWNEIFSQEWITNTI
jgi:hypothetical protein